MYITHGPVFYLKQTFSRLVYEGESVFRLRNFNIVGFSTFILLRYMFQS
jgi:hypothetical protein